MRISLFICSIKNKNTGFGGHYRSLLSYYTQLTSVGNVVSLLHYNELEKTILDNKIENKLDGAKGMFTYYSRSKDYLRTEKIDIVISFTDNLHSNLIRIICKNLNIKFVQILPGGKNRRIPLFFTNCIYFSNENYNNTLDFSINKFLITNRVDEFNCDQNLIDKLTSQYPRRQINVLRVSRLSKKYYDSFIIAINFHNLLLANGFDAQTHIIGLVEDSEIHNELINKTKSIPGIHVISSTEFTADVKLLMSYYDIALGMGRGFWESVSKGLLVLGISSNNDLPVVVNSQNYTLIRSTNFSPRAVIDPSFSIKNHLSNVTSQESRIDNINFLTEQFNNDYSSKMLGNKLQVVLNSVHSDNSLIIIKSLAFALISSTFHIFHRNYANS